jgi:CheY-like chemotaxis protein
VSGASRILVVEDDADIREAMTECLAFEGYDAEGAANGALALAALRTVRYDAIVLDLMMPVMTGREVLAHLSADPSLAAIPVVVCTALRDADVYALGTARLFKPFEVSELLGAVRRLVDPGPASASAAP